MTKFLHQLLNTGSFAQIYLRALISFPLAVAALFIVAQDQQVISFGDFLAISIGVAVATAIFLSFFRNPHQFVRALWERAVFTVWVPVACTLIIGTFFFRIAFFLFKVSLKIIIASVIAIAYVLLPIDIMPDFILGLGQIDDIFVVIALAVWAMGAAISESLRTSISVVRPKTPFP